jgi:hypothetical protein
VRQSGAAAQGSITAQASATIDGESVTLTVKIELQ